MLQKAIELYFQTMQEMVIYTFILLFFWHICTTNRNESSGKVFFSILGLNLIQIIGVTLVFPFILLIVYLSIILWLY